ncbi:MAG: TolC family protein [Firmicutes bacterium]|nr:TolC family protein [Bacillota bacterium]
MKEKMKRTVILVLALAMVLCMPAAAFADTAATTTTAALTPISVSLSDAKAKMLEGVQGELLEIGKLTDKIAATSASEGLSSIREGENAIKNLYAQAAALSATNPASGAALSAYADELKYSMSSASKTDIQRTKKYAESILEPNDKARHNALDLQSIEMYYKLKSAEEGLAISKESYEISKTVYEQTQKKYKLGTVSKVDLLNAELDLAEAKDKLTSTENGVKQARMGFNILFGYELMQPVTLTDSIAVPTLPAIGVEDAVKSALANRNEVKEAAYLLENAEKNLSSFSAYPRTSAKYLQAKVAYLGVKASCDMVPQTVEQDIRTQYDAMHQYYDALQTGEKSVANAKETLRLTQLQYNSGLVTYTTVQQVRLLYESALLSQASAKLNYALAVEKFNMSIDVGTATAGY